MLTTGIIVLITLGTPTTITAIVVGVIAILKCFCEERYKRLKEIVKCCDKKTKKATDEIDSKVQDRGNGHNNIVKLTDSVCKQSVIMQVNGPSTINFNSTGNATTTDNPEDSKETDQLLPQLVPEMQIEPTEDDRKSLEEHHVEIHKEDESDDDSKDEVDRDLEKDRDIPIPEDDENITIPEDDNRTGGSKTNPDVTIDIIIPEDDGNSTEGIKTNPASPGSAISRENIQYQYPEADVNTNAEHLAGILVDTVYNKIHQTEDVCVNVEGVDSYNLAKDFINYKMTSGVNQWDNSIALALRKEGDEMIQKLDEDEHFQKFIENLDLNIDEFGISREFKLIVDSMMEDGKVNWSRIIMVFVIGRELAIKYDNKDIMIRCTGEIIDEKFSKWIIENNGWNALNDLNIDSANYFQSIWCWVHSWYSYFPNMRNSEKQHESEV